MRNLVICAMISVVASSCVTGPARPIDVDDGFQLGVAAGIGQFTEMETVYDDEEMSWPNLQFSGGIGFAKYDLYIGAKVPVLVFLSAVDVYYNYLDFAGLLAGGGVEVSYLPSVYHVLGYRVGRGEVGIGGKISGFFWNYGSRFDEKPPYYTGWLQYWHRFGNWSVGGSVELLYAELKTISDEAKSDPPADLWVFPELESRHAVVARIAVRRVLGWSGAVGRYMRPKA